MRNRKGPAVPPIRKIMPTKRWTSRAAWRYAAFQVPETVLLVVALLLVRRWIDIPTWAFWGLIAAWVIKDLVLFPFVWKSFEPAAPADPMIGRTGVAEGILSPSGWIRIGGERWKAKVGDGCRPIQPGEAVRVDRVEGLTLIVEPAESPDDIPEGG